MLEDNMLLANTILREQIRAHRERGAVMVAPGEVDEMRADIALLEHQLAATMLHVDLPPLPPWIDIDVTAVGASGGALGSGAGSDMHPCDGHECWSLPRHGGGNPHPGGHARCRSFLGELSAPVGDLGAPVGASQQTPRQKCRRNKNAERRDTHVGRTVAGRGQVDWQAGAGRGGRRAMSRARQAGRRKDRRRSQPCPRHVAK